MRLIRNTCYIILIVDAVKIRSTYCHFTKKSNQFLANNYYINNRISHFNLEANAGNEREAKFIIKYDFIYIKSNTFKHRRPTINKYINLYIK